MVRLFLMHSNLERLQAFNRKLNAIVFLCPIEIRLQAFNEFQKETNEWIDVHNGLVVKEKGFIQILELQNQNCICYIETVLILSIRNWLQIIEWDFLKEIGFRCSCTSERHRSYAIWYFVEFVGNEKL